MILLLRWRVHDTTAESVIHTAQRILSVSRLMLVRTLHAPALMCSCSRDGMETYGIAQRTIPRV